MEAKNIFCMCLGFKKESKYHLDTSHSAYVATATESNGAKIDDF